MNINFQNLRRANQSRQTEWQGADRIDVPFRALELVNEAGEIADAVKKWLRFQRKITGRVATKTDIAQEIADTVISLDLLAMDLDMGFLYEDPSGDRPSANEITMVVHICARAAKIADLVLQPGFVPEDGRMTWNKSLQFQIQAGALVWCLTDLAKALGIDLGDAVTTKFNKTSEAYRLTTRMAAA